MNSIWLRLCLIIGVVLIVSAAAVMAGDVLFPVLDTNVQEDLAKEEQQEENIGDTDQVQEATAEQDTETDLEEGEAAEPEGDLEEEGEVTDLEGELEAEQEAEDISEEEAAERKNEHEQEIADDRTDHTSLNADLEIAIQNTISWYRENRNLPEQEWWEAYTALWGAGEDLSETGRWKTNQYWRNEGPGNLAPGHPGNEHIRYAFMLLSVKQDPTNAWGGRNLLAELAAQQEDDGSFGHIGRHIWAMELLNIGRQLGLDVGNWAEQGARQKAVNWLLSEQNENGSFGQFSELDFTGWTLITLSYSKNYDGVNEAINDALNYLEKRQQEDPGTAGFSGGDWTDYNANSQAAVISGLVALGEDLMSANSRWVRNGETLLEAQLKFQHEGGFFQWTKDNPGDIDMATSQSLIALLDIKHGEYTRHRMARELSFD